MRVMRVGATIGTEDESREDMSFTGALGCHFLIHPRAPERHKQELTKHHSARLASCNTASILGLGLRVERLDTTRRSK